MSFTSPELLQDLWGATSVISFQQAKPGVLEKLIIAADSIITSESGLQPPSDPASQTSDAAMLVYAGWIIRYLMIEHQSIESDKELELREKNYKLALDALKRLRGQKTTTDTAKPTPQYTTTKRVGDMI